MKKLLIGVGSLSMLVACTPQASQPAKNNTASIPAHRASTTEIQAQVPQPAFPEPYTFTADEPSISKLPHFLAQANNAAPYVVGQDGAFLGVVSSDRIEENSLCNQIGDYGSKISTMSIRNRIGDYGSQISNLSAYNPNAQNPPAIVENGQVVAFLTKNRRIEGGLDPELFFYNVCGE